MTTTHSAPSAPAPGGTAVGALNPEAELAYRFVTETDRHVFLTGRAGTGKTTLLHRLRGDLAKAHAVVAPTGVAAINAKGVTIHSQLQLPFGTLTEARMNTPEGRRLSKAKIEVLRRIDLLIIDEVSMVRADVMDAIDVKLRRVRRNQRPFGGVQLLLIGDLHQLPPVVTRDEERDMAERYATPYFFSAEAFADAGLVTVELQHVYRQTDADFVQLLGEVRANRMTHAVLETLNTRYRPVEEERELEGYITLTSHRRAADQINRDRLRAMKSKASRYTAKVTGKFPEGSYPTDAELELKVGAQVMFVKNDPDGAYHNGKIGVVTAVEEDTVTVDCGAGGGRITTGAVRWENNAYTIGGSERDVNTTMVGSFSQIPLRLAWAITIHKSQGLTFDRVVIDAADAFAHGQVYVALSRCRTFEGIVLRSRIGGGSVRTDAQVKEYTTDQRAAAPDADLLKGARVAYRERLLREAYSFGDLARAAGLLRRHGLTELRSYPGLKAEDLDGVFNAVKDDLQRVGQSFAQQLATAIAATDLDADPVPVPQRCRQAAVYFVDKLQEIDKTLVSDLDLESDNADVSARGEELYGELTQALVVARAVLKLFDAESFDPNAVVSTRAKLSLAAPGSDKPKARSARSGGLPKVEHPMLYTMLGDWRTPKARERDVRTNQILSSKTMRAICAELPRSGPELKAIEGMGQVKVERYGEELLQLIDDFVASGMKTAPVTEAAGGSAKPLSNTVALTTRLLQSGKAVEEIALTRALTENTIYGHLVQATRAGAIDGSGILSERDFAAITRALQEVKGNLRDAHRLLAKSYSQNAIKLAKEIGKRYAAV